MKNIQKVFLCVVLTIVVCIYVYYIIQVEESLTLEQKLDYDRSKTFINDLHDDTLLSQQTTLSNGCMSSWHQKLTQSLDGTYTIAYCFPQDAAINMTTNLTINVNDICRDPLCSSKKQLAFDDLQNIDDIFWKRNFNRSVYKLYPQTYNESDLMDRIFGDKPINLVRLKPIIS